MPAKAKPPVTLNDLPPNPKNPRKPWRDEQQKESFLHSLQAFGDLSGIVFNLTSRQLVGGHKRVEEFRAEGSNAKLTITERLSKPDAAGTVAYGHVTMSNGVRFAYREVKWDAPKEAAANLAANKWGAEWDMPAVADMLVGIKDSGFDLDLTGFAFPEIDALLSGDYDDTGGSSAAGHGCDPENVYSGKIEAPVYEITGECPPLGDLVDRAKADELITKIDRAKGIPEDVRKFLRTAAERHVGFDYGKVAEYYAHAPKAVQRLMEDSALVIIDFDRAVEGGFVRLSQRMRELHINEQY